MSNETVTPTIELIALLEAAGFVRDVKPEVKQGGRYKPKNGEAYYCNMSDGEWAVDTWRNSDVDNRRYAMGNCYRTKEEATADRDKQLALVRVQDKLEELTGEPLDWGDENQNKAAIGYNHHKGIFIFNIWTYVEVLGGLYGSEQACEWVINNMKSDLRLIAGIA